MSFLAANAASYVNNQMFLSKIFCLNHLRNGMLSSWSIINGNQNSSDTFPLLGVRYSQVSLINRESLDIVRLYYQTLIAMFGGIWFVVYGWPGLDHWTECSDQVTGWMGQARSFTRVHPNHRVKCSLIL